MARSWNSAVQKLTALARNDLEQDRIALLRLPRDILIPVVDGELQGQIRRSVSYRVVFTYLPSAESPAIENGDPSRILIARGLANYKQIVKVGREEAAEIAHWQEKGYFLAAQDRKFVYLVMHERGYLPNWAR